MELEGEIGLSIILVGNFNIFLSVMIEQGGEKIPKDIEDLENDINQLVPNRKIWAL